VSGAGVAPRLVMPATAGITREAACLLQSYQLSYPSRGSPFEQLWELLRFRDTIHYYHALSRTQTKPINDRVQ